MSGGPVSDRNPDGNVTRTLAEYVVNSRWDDIPEDVRHEAATLAGELSRLRAGRQRRSGGRHRDSRARRRTPGSRVAAILGRAERLDPLHASLMNGISSHVDDFDDTTPQNYIHPSSPVASALFAYASVNPVSGRDFVHAFVLGFEAESRVGNAVYPAHYDAGWHITGTAGVFGAAAAIGRLRGLDAQQMVWAIGLAATQAAGLREMFGSMGEGVSSRPRGAERLRVGAAGGRGLHGRRARASKGRAGSPPCRRRAYDLSK